MLLNEFAESVAAEPATTVLLAVSAVLYAIGVRNLWRHAGRGRGVALWQVASFAGGILALTIALVSPLAELAEALLSAHMTQHELLMLVAAPLLVFGHPLFVWMWAFGDRGRDRLGGIVRARAISVTWRALTAPLIVVSLHAAALWIWHMPVLYQAALESEGVHVAQHLCFFLTASLFWWGMVKGRYGRIGYGAAVAYVFVTVLHSAILGALMTIAPALWYPAYAATAEARHVDPLADQQLAGLLMWIPSGIVLIVLGLALFAAWLGEAERRVRLSEWRTAPGDRAIAPDLER